MLSGRQARERQVRADGHHLLYLDKQMSLFLLQLHYRHLPSSHSLSFYNLKPSFLLQLYNRHLSSYRSLSICILHSLCNFITATFRHPDLYPSVSFIPSATSSPPPSVIPIFNNLDPSFLLQLHHRHLSSSICIFNSLCNFITAIFRHLAFIPLYSLIVFLKIVLYRFLYNNTYVN